MRRNTKLEEFKKLSKEEQVKKVNDILKKLEKPTFGEVSKVLGFSHVGQFFRDYYINTETKQLEKRVTTEATNLTEDEIISLKNLVLKLKNNEDAKKYSKGEIITRSIRVDKEAMDIFTEYCNNMGIKMVHAISQALIDYVNR